MTDERIVELYWNRDESAVTETQLKYGRYLIKIAYNILTDMEDSLESVNDTYMHAWKAMPPHRPSVLSSFPMLTGSPLYPLIHLPSHCFV